MCVAMAESAPISLVTISCTMLASGPSSSRIVAAMWAKTDSGKRAIVSLCALMKSSSCATWPKALAQEVRWGVRYSGCGLLVQYQVS